MGVGEDQDHAEFNAIDEEQRLHTELEHILEKVEKIAPRPLVAQSNESPQEETKSPRRGMMMGLAGIGVVALTAVVAAAMGGSQEGNVGVRSIKIKSRALNTVQDSIPIIPYEVSYQPLSDIAFKLDGVVPDFISKGPQELANITFGDQELEGVNNFVTPRVVEHPPKIVWPVNGTDQYFTLMLISLPAKHVEGFQVTLYSLAQKDPHREIQKFGYFGEQEDEMREEQEKKRNIKIVIVNAGPAMRGKLASFPTLTTYKPPHKRARKYGKPRTKRKAKKYKRKHHHHHHHHIAKYVNNDEGDAAIDYEHLKSIDTEKWSDDDKEEEEDYEDSDEEDDEDDESKSEDHSLPKGRSLGSDQDSSNEKEYVEISIDPDKQCIHKKEEDEKDICNQKVWNGTRRSTSELAKLHWFIYNIPETNIENGKEIHKYKKPTLSENKDEHHFVVMIFKQMAGPSKTGPTTLDLASGVDMDQYLHENGLSIWAGNVFKMGRALGRSVGQHKGIKTQKEALETQI